MGDIPNYIMASRQGLYVVNRMSWRLVTEGYFFGVTTRGPEIYCFKTVTKKIGELNPSSGQIVRYTWHGGTLIGPEILVEGLHHNCHQVDFFNGKFYVVDTRHQRILVYEEQW